MLKIGKITNALCLTNIIEKIIIRIVVLYKNTMIIYLGVDF